MILNLLKRKRYPIVKMEDDNKKEYKLSKTEFKFCPNCSSKKIFYIEHTLNEDSAIGDFNHYCKNCKCVMIMKCLSENFNIDID